MANINFPANPTAGQTYTFNGNVWTYNGYGWVLSGTIGPQGPAGNKGATGSITPAYGIYLGYNFR